MKTKQQILKAIKCCSKMGTMREQECCSRCPYKKEEFCYKHLMSDLNGMWITMCQHLSII